jgi:hypothetical protein
MTKTQKILAITGGVLVLAGVTWIIVKQVNKNKGGKSNAVGVPAYAVAFRQGNSGLAGLEMVKNRRNTRGYSACCGE